MASMRVHYRFYRRFIASKARRRAAFLQGAGSLFESCLTLLELTEQGAVLFQLFTLVCDDLLRCAGNNLLVRELALKHGDLPEAVFLLLGDAGKLLFNVNELC